MAAQTTKLSAVGEAVRKLRAAADHDADKVLQRVQELDTTRQRVNTQIHQHLDDHKRELDTIEKEFAALEAATNGGPSLEDGPGQQDPQPERPAPDPTVILGGHAASIM